MTEAASGWDDSRCWFCEVRPAGADSGYELALYRYTERDPGAVPKPLYETTRISVPRCGRCRSLHVRLGIGFVTLWLILTMAFIVWYFSQPETIPGGTFTIAFGSLLCLIPVALLRLVASKLWKPEDSAEKYPGVVALLNQKWQLGSQPPSKPFRR